MWWGCIKVTQNCVQLDLRIYLTSLIKLVVVIHIPCSLLQFFTCCGHLQMLLVLLLCNLQFYMCLCINVNVTVLFISISLNFTAATYQLICAPDLMIWYLSFPELVLSHEVLFGALWDQGTHRTFDEIGITDTALQPFHHWCQHHHSISHVQIQISLQSGHMNQP